MNYFGFIDEIIDYFTPPAPTPRIPPKPYFETKMIEARNIDSGETVWLELPVSQRRLRDERVHGGDSF